MYSWDGSRNFLGGEYILCGIGLEDRHKAAHMHVPSFFTWMLRILSVNFIFLVYLELTTCKEIAIFRVKVYASVFFFEYQNDWCAITIEQPVSVMKKNHNHKWKYTILSKIKKVKKK